MRHTHDSPGRRRHAADPPPRRPRRRWLRRALTSNVTYTLVAIGLLSALVMNLSSLSFLGLDEVDPPQAAAADMSVNDMLALLSASDMDPLQADAVANAKRRAYQQQLKEEREARKRAAWYRKNKTKIEASRKAASLRTINPSAGQNKAYGKQMNALKGWSRCWDSLETLWDHESDWNERAENPSSGAYGIPQALPASKLASAGSDWRTSSPTQIAWGLSYIKARYGDPCQAWAFWQSHNWY